MSMPDAKFDASAYWKERLRQHFDLIGVGFKRRSVAYNRWVYRVRTESLDELFRRHGWPIEGKAVLDVGCGTGYFIDHWLQRRARRVTGLDVTEVSVERLRNRFPEAEFVCADIAEPNVDVGGTFDLISIFDVLYHIVDDKRFEQAVKNLSRLCHPGSRVIITDMFGKRTVEVVKHVRNRSKDRYQEIFSKNGFRLLELRPLFFTLMPPSRLANRPAYWVGTLGWEALTFPARWEWLGGAIGSVLYGVDSGLRRWFPRGPSHHLAVFEFTGTEPTP
jgi:SAM-dependent methyltransferase